MELKGYNKSEIHLLGMNAYHPELFEDITWSTDSVFEETLRIAHRKGLNVGRLEVLTDIDYAGDWERYGF